MTTDAKKRANRKYMENTYKNLQVQAKISDYEQIDNFCKNMGISKAQFIISACKYFMKLGELPPEE